MAADPKKLRRKRLAVAGLLAAASAFALLSQFLFRIDALSGSALAAALSLTSVVYVLLMIWPHLRRLGWSYQFTQAGIIYILAVLLVAFAALASGNNLLFLVLACMLAALLVSGLFSRLNLAELELQCAVGDHVFAGRDVPLRMLVRNLKPWLPSFSIFLHAELPPSAGGTAPEVFFPMIRGGQACSALVSGRFPRRGIFRQDTFWLRSGFPFGFLRRSVRLRMPREIVVYPSVAPTPELDATLPRLSSEWERRLAGLGQDLYRIRPYQTGDSSRVVHWKASAHTGELKVREFTVEEDRRVEFLLDRSLPGGPQWPPRFEKGVELCASLAWRLHTAGAGVRFTVSDPGSEPSERLENIYDILRYLALVAPVEGGAPLLVQPSGLFQVIFTASAASLPPGLPESSYYCYYLENV